MCFIQYSLVPDYTEIRLTKCLLPGMGYDIAALMSPYTRQLNIGALSRLGGEKSRMSEPQN